MNSAAWRSLAISVGSASLISLVQKLFDVGLGPVAADLIEYYRLIGSTIIGFPFRLIEWAPPQQLVDLWSISFVGAGAWVRQPNIEDCELLRMFNVGVLSTKSKLLLWFAIGTSGIGAGLIAGMLMPTTYFFSEDDPDLMRGMAKNVAICAIAAIGFFAWNAYAPSAL